MNFHNLHWLDCSFNQLKFIPDTMNFSNLEYFDCRNNQLISLPDMNFPNLEHFDCADNQLTALPDNMNLPNLQIFHCYDNQLTSLPICILNFRNLQQFSYQNNMIEMSLQLARFIDRMDTSFNKKLNVYNDTQNVHNSTIQLCVRDSINHITTRTDLKKYNIDELHTLIIWLKTNNLITEISTQLLFEYIADTTVHSLLLLTFSEVLWFIIQTIITDFSDIIQAEIFKILNQEIIDADCKCFTGRMNRIINCLNGFSPLVNININDGEQIGNIIILVKNKLELTGIYTIEQHKIEVEKELLERNYDIETIKTWLEYID
jgi:Leucine-rich repeat (LRR) protein